MAYRHNRSLRPLVTREEADAVAARVDVDFERQCAMKVNGARCTNRGVPRPGFTFYICGGCLRGFAEQLKRQGGAR